MFADFIKIEGITNMGNVTHYVNRALITCIKVYTTERVLRLSGTNLDGLNFATEEALNRAIETILNGK